MTTTPHTVAVRKVSPYSVMVLLAASVENNPRTNETKTVFPPKRSLHDADGLVLCQSLSWQPSSPSLFRLPRLTKTLIPSRYRLPDSKTYAITSTGKPRESKQASSFTALPKHNSIQLQDPIASLATQKDFPARHPHCTTAQSIASQGTPTFKRH